jgi:hypothetical protein
MRMLPDESQAGPGLSLYALISFDIVLVERANFVTCGAQPKTNRRYIIIPDLIFHIVYYMAWLQLNLNMVYRIN